MIVGSIGFQSAQCCYGLSVCLVVHCACGVTAFARQRCCYILAGVAALVGDEHLAGFVYIWCVMQFVLLIVCL